MKRLKNNSGEGQISVGVKIILAVVIGALILGGLYLLFDWSYQHKHKIRNSTKVIKPRLQLTKHTVNFFVQK